MTTTRISAVSCLNDILKHGARPKKSLEQFSQTLDRRDRAFLMEIVYGVMRNLYALDAIIKTFIRNTKTLSDETLNNLRIALYQILFMRVPGYAVVNEAVEMEKLGGKPSLVNAVLRNLLRGKDKIALPLVYEDVVKDISINTSHQEWMVKRWIARFGRDEARLLAEANNCMPPLVLRTNTLRISRDELLRGFAEKEISAEASRFSPDGVVIGKETSYQDLSSFYGLFAVQDEASQLISYLLAPKKGERVLDSCAAPGGKTTHIAQIMEDKGEIIAVEKDPQRILKLEESIATLGVGSAKTIRSDISELNDIGTFDRILLDAPCSSTGVIRRNPDIKYRHALQDIIEFRKKQSGLLTSIAPLLRKGGRLVYSVCSIEPEEGEEVIRAFLKTTDEFRIIEADQEFMKPFVKNGFFRTLPHTDNMDGFFGVILCRKT
ncbi:MAG: 16S rRNA (cytosine(967)-C(5))-methyltransferase RsmB [Nitrospirota bacterium]|nr:16S rRNA (cytosine(967)-C(5))-methyltransferase RsmB [Nitrospirota bacterium]